MRPIGRIASATSRCRDSSQSIMDSDALALILGIFGLVSLALACQRLIRGRFFAASGTGLLAVLLLAAGGLLFVISSNLHTYARLTHEEPVAELVFELAAPQRYR